MKDQKIKNASVMEQKNMVVYQLLATVVILCAGSSAQPVLYQPVSKQPEKWFTVIWNDQSDIHHTRGENR